MTTESDCRDTIGVRGISRRDFLKLAVVTSLVAAGCSANQEPTAAPTAEPTATPTSAPTATPTIEPTSGPTAIPTYTAADFEQMAYCGIRCQTACPGYEYPSRCDGCKSVGGKLEPFCEVCAIRKCAAEKQVLTCAQCDEYPSCKVDTWTRYPVLKRRMDQMRKDLQS